MTWRAKTRMTKREQLREASNRLPGDSDFHDLTKYLTGEIYTSPRRQPATHFWGINYDWWAYCRLTLATHWDGPADTGSRHYLYGYEVAVDEKYGIPKLMPRD